LDEHFRAHGLTLSSKDVLLSLKGVADGMNYETLDDLFVAVGVGQRSPETVSGQYFFRQRLGHRVATPSASILSLESTNLPHRLAKCCNPRPPDPIVGYKTREGVVTIHRADCRIAKQHKPLFSAEWVTSLEADITQIEIEAVDRPGLIRDVSMLIAERGLAISSFHADRNQDGSAVLQIVFDIGISDFSTLRAALQRLPDVRKVKSVTPSMPSHMARDAVVKQLFHNPYTLNPATGRNFVGRNESYSN
jgi:GTP pyrophosphokinase